LKDFTMNKRLITTILIFFFMVLALMACADFPTPVRSTPVAHLKITPSPLPGDTQGTEYAAAQATLASGQSQMTEISHQATVVSRNMAQAAATQQVIANQTQMVWDATATAQSQDATIAAQSQGATATGQSQDATAIAQNQGGTATAQSQDATTVAQNQGATAIAQNQDATAVAQNQNTTATAQSQDATATESTYIRNVTQTVQAQGMQDIEGTHTAQANATLAAYSLTATPWAALQAGIVQMRNESNRRTWWGEFVTTPLKVILITLVVLLFIVGAVMAYRRLMPVLDLRLRSIWRDNNTPLLIIDGTSVDHDPPHRRLSHWVLRQPNLPQSTNYELPPVEIIDPSDPSIALWITETEQKLATDGRIQL
jgi:hypothetical protein